MSKREGISSKGMRGTKGIPLKGTELRSSKLNLNLNQTEKERAVELSREAGVSCSVFVGKLIMSRTADDLVRNFKHISDV